METPKIPHRPSGKQVTRRKPTKGEDFGAEGTNKTRPAPKPDNAAPEDLGIKPHVEKSPYTRG